MAITQFNASAWQTLCQACYDRCGKRAQTPMHHMFLFSQTMDEALKRLDAAHLSQGTRIAQGFGYESHEERSAYVNWFSQHHAEPTLRA